MNFAQLQNDVFLTNLYSTIQQNRNMELVNRAFLERTTSFPMVSDMNHITMSNFLASLHDIFNTGIPRPKIHRSVSEPINNSIPHLSRYKTELCRPFEEEGECKYVDKCQFAHGVHELRTLERHPKYKTELCRTFHSVGFCPYGSRCHFIHSSQDVLENQTRMQQKSRKKVSVNESTSLNHTKSVLGDLSKVFPDRKETHIRATNQVQAQNDLDDARLPIFNRMNLVDAINMSNMEDS